MADTATTTPAATAPAATGAKAEGVNAPPAPVIEKKPGEATPGAKASEPSAAEVVRKLKLVIDGKEEELDEKEVIARAQKATAAEKRMEEAALTRKQMTALVHLLKTNPMAVLQDKTLGHDARKLVEDWLWDQYQVEKMSPEQREAHDNKEKLKKLEAERAEERRSAEAKKHEELKATYRAEYEKDIFAALDAAKIPRTGWAVKRVSEYLLHGLNRGIKNLKASDVIDLVRRDYANEYKEMFGAMDAEVIESILGEEGLKKVREHELKKLNGAPPAPPDNPPGPSGTPAARKKPLNREEWAAELDKRVNGA